MKSLRARVRKNSMYGVVFGGVLSALVIVLSGLATEVEVQGRTIPVWQIVVFYLGGGLAGGAAIGAVEPWSRGRFSKALIGGVVGSALGLTIGIAFGGSENLAGVVGAGLAVGLFGAIIGAIL